MEIKDLNKNDVVEWIWRDGNRVAVAGGTGIVSLTKTKLVQITPYSVSVHPIEFLNTVDEWKIKSKSKNHYSYLQLVKR